jgi:hypothetical protein
MPSPCQDTRQARKDGKSPVAIHIRHAQPPQSARFILFFGDIACDPATVFPRCFHQVALPKNHDLSTQNSLKRLIFNTLTPTEPLHDESHFTIEDALDPHQANPNPSASFREISVGCKKDTAIDWRPIPSTLSRQTIGDVSLCVSDHLGSGCIDFGRTA